MGPVGLGVLARTLSMQSAQSENEERERERERKQKDNSDKVNAGNVLLAGVEHLVDFFG